MKKVYELLRGFASGKVAAGALVFVIGYTSGGYVNCPLCGGQGYTPGNGASPSASSPRRGSYQ